jgi:hypothetical protein
MFGTGPIRLMMLSLRRAYLRAESGGGHLAATADQIDYWIRRHLVPCPPQRNVNPARDRLVALTAIGKTLRDQYDAVAAPAPRHLATLVSNSRGSIRSAEFGTGKTGSSRPFRQFPGFVARTGRWSSFRCTTILVCHSCRSSAVNSMGCVQWSGFPLR